jgi:hypothetical protein
MWLELGEKVCRVFYYDIVREVASWTNRKWALGVAPNRGEALGRKPGARILKLPSNIWGAELRNTDSCGGLWAYKSAQKPQIHNTESVLTKLNI